MNSLKRYVEFKNQCERSKKKLVQTLQTLYEEKKRVVGYGATSKSTTILNYCNIDSSLIEFITDTSPLKINKHSPGMHIPIRDYESFVNKYPDYAILFAWNHKREIFEKETTYINSGGKWINFVPRISIE